MTYLLDEFTTSEAAPIASPRVCEPGPGNLSVIQSDGDFSISGERLHYGAGPVTPGGLGFWHLEGVSRAAGKALTFNIAPENTGMQMIGWLNGSGVGYSQILGRALLISGGQFSGIGVGGNAPGTGQTYSAGVVYQGYHILRPSGSFIVIRGGAYEDYTLIFVDHAGTDTTLYAGFSRGSGSGSLGGISAWDIGGRWDTQYGIATNRIISGTSASTLSMPDAINEVTWVAGTGQILDLQVRRTDDNNCWITRCNQATGMVQLIEKVGGVETIRDSDAQVGGFTVGTTFRVISYQFGSSIRNIIYNTSTNIYATRNIWDSASFNQLARGVKATGAAWTDLVAWPYHVGHLF